MSTIATVAAVVCVCSISCSLIGVISPQGNTRRILNTVIGAFILCCMIIPIKNAITNFHLDIQIPKSADTLTASADEAYNNAVIVETQALLENRLKTLMLQNNINISSANLTLEGNENGGIYIGSISIYINKAQENLVGKIKTLTEKEFQITPIVTVR